MLTKIMEASTDFFIAVIECNRIIYDKASSDFKNVLKKEEAWNRIAKAVKMTVEAAKKRYNSIRQKYCREKQKMELYIRTKRPYRPWAFNERLQFLDPFIHSRATFTNDTGFDVEGSADSRYVGEVEHTDIEENVDLPSESLNNGTEDSNCEPTAPTDTQIITYNDEDVQNHNSFEFVDESENHNNAIVSDYSGEITVFTPLNTVPVSDHDDNVTTLNMPRDASHSSKISSQKSQSDTNLTTLNMPRGVSHNSKTSSQQSERDKNLTTQNGSIGVNPTLRVATTTQRNQVNAASSSVRQTTLIQPSHTSTSVNDKNMDAIRNKMDSCLTAIASKAAEKTQRSPHAPFLAYLGTKLPIVPADKLPAVEKEILKIVEDASL